MISLKCVKTGAPMGRGTAAQMATLKKQLEQDGYKVRPSLG